MAYAFVQQKENSAGSGTVTSIATGNSTAPQTAANALFWVAAYEATSAKTVTWTDTAGNGAAAYVETGNLFNAGQQIGFRWGYVKNIKGATNNSTVTFSAGVTFPGVYTSELSGLDPVTLFTSGEVASQLQNAPGTGANAITTGNTPALSFQPAVLIGFSYNVNNAQPPAAGTGFTARTTVWNTGGASPAARPIDKRLTATTATAATFTATTGTDLFVSVAVVFRELVIASTVPLMGQICL